MTITSDDSSCSDILSSERPVCVALEGSNQYDVVTCAEVGVVDDQPMILLGTYGKVRLALRAIEESSPKLDSCRLF